MSTRWAILGFVAVALLFGLGLPVEFRYDEFYMDPVTGSTRVVTSWRVPWPRSAVEHRTALDRWLVAHEGTYLPHWVFYHRRYRNVLGSTIGWACGRTPAIYGFRDDVADRFIKNSTNAEISEFIDVMRNGTEANQRDAIDVAWQRVFEVMNREPLPKDCGR